MNDKISAPIIPIVKANLGSGTLTLRTSNGKVLLHVGSGEFVILQSAESLASALFVLEDDEHPERTIRLGGGEIRIGMGEGVNEHVSLDSGNLYLRMGQSDLIRLDGQTGSMGAKGNLSLGGDISADGGISANGSISASGNISTTGNLTRQRITERSRQVGPSESYDLFPSGQDGTFIVELAAVATDPNTFDSNQQPLVKSSYSRWTVLVEANKAKPLHVGLLEEVKSAEEFWSGLEGPKFQVVGGAVRFFAGKLAHVVGKPWTFHDGTLCVRSLYGTLLTF
jgi:hypothetical protein